MLKHNARGAFVGPVRAALDTERCWEDAALWGLHDAKDFLEAVLKAVNLGDDADTTGAVCGQLAGAYWGEAGIREEWLEGLARRHMIEGAMEGLLASA